MRLVHVQFATDVENPSECGSGWKLHSFSPRHVNYTPPEELQLRPTSRNTAPVVRCVGLRRKLDVGLAFWVSYYEHGNCVWFLLNHDPPGTEMVWDGVRFAGLLVWPYSPADIGAKTLAERTKDAANFLRYYTAWANGQLLEFSIRDATDPDGMQDNVIWSCEHVDEKSMAEDVAEQLGPADAFKIVGEAAAWLNPAKLEEARKRQRLSRQSAVPQLVTCGEQ